MVLNTPKVRISEYLISFIRLMASIGRGIVAGREIQAGSIVDISPVLVMASKDLDAVKSTILHHYT